MKIKHLFINFCNIIIVVAVVDAPIRESGSEHGRKMHEPGERISRRLADQVVRVSGVRRVVQIRDGDVDAGALLNGLQQRGERFRKQVVSPLGSDHEEEMSRKRRRENGMP